MRDSAGFKSDDYGAPMDVLWFRLPRKETDDREMFGHFEDGTMMIMIDRGDYWQCAFVIPKGGIDRIRAEGLDAFREHVVAMSPFLADRIDELKNWDDIKLLTVAVDRLRQWWRPGLICIGDAAHAMSPIGGVGVNLAVQDAVAAANRLAAPLRAGTVSDNDLQAIQARRIFPVRFTQGFQLIMQKRIIGPVLSGRAAEAALAVQAVRSVSGFSADPRSPSGGRGPAGAYPHAGLFVLIQVRCAAARS